MGADYYMMGKWERERKHDNGEYIEKAAIVKDIKKRIAFLIKEERIGNGVRIEELAEVLRSLGEDV